MPLRNSIGGLLASSLALLLFGCGGGGTASAPASSPAGHGDHAAAGHGDPGGAASKAAPASAPAASKASPGPGDHSGHGAKGHGDHGAKGHGGHAPASSPDGAQAKSIPLSKIPEAVLLDQHGAEVNLREDLIANQLVAMNFIFTTCGTICPPMGANFAQLQKQMKEEGTDVRFVSVSIDPARDTPARLKEWADRFGGDPAWRLLTGETHTVDGVLKDLGVYSALKNDHAPIVLLGNDRTGTWKRAYGLAAPSALAEQLRTLAKEDPP